MDDAFENALRIAAEKVSEAEVEEMERDLMSMVEAGSVRTLTAITQSDKYARWKAWQAFSEAKELAAVGNWTPQRLLMHMCSVQKILETELLSSRAARISLEKRITARR